MGLANQKGRLASLGPTANQKSARTQLAPPARPTFTLNSSGGCHCELVSPDTAAISVLSPNRCCLRRGRTGVWRDMASSGCEDQQGQEEESFLYFAYGSNLLSERIHLRNPSAAFCCVARLQVSAPRPASATLCHPTDEGAGNAALPDTSTSCLRDRAAALLGKPTSPSPPRA